MKIEHEMGGAGGMAMRTRHKTRITIYLDDEVLDSFRAMAERHGQGYQTLINAALRSRITHEQQEAGAELA